MADPGHDYLVSVYNQAHPNAPMDTSGLTGVSADAAAYPAFAPLMGIPEVADLLHQASTGGWSNDQLSLHLYETNWWKSQSDTERQWQAMKLVDPAKAAQQKQQQYNTVATEAQLMGVPLSPTQVDFIAEGSIAGGWDANTLKTAIAGNAQQSRDRAGTITATQTQLHGIAASYGVPISDHTAFQWAQNISEGKTDQNGFTEYAKQQAIASHPYWQKQLTDGMTVQQLADPYVQTASKLLERAPSSIDLSDPKWSSSFVQTAKDGSKAPMGMDQWQTKLMSTPQYGWDQTANARDAAFQVSDQIRQSFGAQ
jgi:hypothetical protein